MHEYAKLTEKDACQVPKLGKLGESELKEATRECKPEPKWSVHVTCHHRHLQPPQQQGLYLPGVLFHERTNS